VFPVSRPPFCFPAEVTLNYAQCNVGISSGDFSIFKNKLSNVEFASKGDLCPLIQRSPSLSHFHQKIIHNTLTYGDIIRYGLDYFENFNVILSRCDSSRNSPKRNGKFQRATEIFKKNEGGCYFAPPAVRGLF